MAKRLGLYTLRDGRVFDAYGPYRVNRGNIEGRWIVVLYNSTDTTSMSYPRFLMEHKIGRFLDDDEEVHHIDQDRDNNEIDNLEILTKTEHLLAHGRRCNPLDKMCETCGSTYTSRWPGKAGDRQRFCSPECSQKSRRKFEVGSEDLKSLVEILPLVAVGKLLGVSDTAIRKRCKILGIPWKRSSMVRVAVS